MALVQNAPQDLAPRALPAQLQTLGGKIVVTIVASLFVAVCAHVSVPLWFTPIPFTLSDLAVILVGLVLGPALGFSALALYLIEGASGLPVFSPTGPGGLAQLFFWATSGYLLAYPFAAALAGSVSRLLSRAFGTRLAFTATLFGAAAGSVLLMASGTAWLGHFAHLTPTAAIAAGFTPFLAVQAAKILIAASLTTSIARLRRQ